jgi:hypothetical protein
MTLHTITAHFDHPDAPLAYQGCYSYSDPKVKVVGEPLVHDASQAIICAMAFAGLCKTDDPPSVINLRFTDNIKIVQDFPDTCLIIKLSLAGFEDDYNLYDHEIISPTEAAMNAALADELIEAPLVPLCPHLLDYFDKPPTVFYVKITVVKGKGLVTPVPA